MIIKLSAFALVSIVMLIGNVPVSIAVGDSDGQSSQDELSVTKDSLQQAKQKIDDLERQLKQRIGELVLQLRAKENEITALRSSIHENSKQLREDLASQTEELNQAKRRVAELEQQLAATGKGQELAQAKRRAAEAEQQTAKKEQELAQVKEDLKQVTQKLADLNPQLTAKDAELARTKQLLADFELNPPKQAGPTPAQEENPPSLALEPIDHHLSLTNLLGPDSEVTDDGETFTSSGDLGKINESLTNLLLPELKKGSASMRQRGNKLTLVLATGELFPTGDATVTLGGASLLERVGVVLHGFRYQSIEVAGHTDNQPLRNDPRKGFRDNVELSRTRADHAIQVLISGGLEANRVKAVGYADSKPLATNDTEKGRSKNRRMEIVITQGSESGSNVGDGRAQADKKIQDTPLKR